MPWMRVHKLFGEFGVQAEAFRKIPGRDYQAVGLDGSRVGNYGCITF